MDTPPPSSNYEPTPPPTPEPPAASVPALLRYGLRPALFSPEFAAALYSAAVSTGSEVPYHLKINTGMNRIGVEWADAASFAVTLRGLPGITLEGVFTHFATADVPGDWDFERQMERFARVVEELRGSVSYAATDDPSAFERTNYRRTLHSWTTPYHLTPSSTSGT